MKIRIVLIQCTEFILSTSLSRIDLDFCKVSSTFMNFSLTFVLKGRDLFFVINSYLFATLLFDIRYGDIAQMVERSLSMREVSGSIPDISI